MKAENAGEHQLRFALLLLLVAFALRATVALLLAREPVWDGHYYHFGATRIASGLGYSEDVMGPEGKMWKAWTHYPVGYSAFLAFFYWLFGSGLAVAPLANSLVSALTVLVGYQLARGFVSPKRARLAALLLCFHPGLISYSAAVMTEGLAACLLLLVGLVRLRAPPGLRGAAATAIVLAAAVLVRPTSLLLLPLLPLLDERWSLKSAKQLALTLGLTLLLIAPWTLRNCLRMDGCALVSTNGGWNLAIGALTETGRFRTLRASDGCPVVTGQVQQDRCWARVGLSVIASDPLRWLGMIPEKLRQTFNHQSFIVEYLHEADPNRFAPGFRERARSSLTALQRALYCLASLACISASALSLRRPKRPRDTLVQAAFALGLLALQVMALVDDTHPFWLLVVLLPLLGALPLPGRPTWGPVGRYLLGLIFSTVLVHAVFFGDDRYHIVVTPVLCILAAGALRAPGRSPPALVPGQTTSEPKAAPVGRGLGPEGPIALT